MCGLAGLLYKQTSGDGDLGQPILTMLDVLGSRGVDGTGIALYGPSRSDRLVARVRLGGSDDPQVQANRAVQRVAALARVVSADVQHDYLRLELSSKRDVAELAAAIEGSAPEVLVFSLGESLEIVKQVGPADALRERYELDHYRGTHGIGHTRLATESRVDVAHCHPFWARPFPDVAVVHNGQLTNYHKMRRRFEMRGVQFHTENDSEFIAIYLADKLAAGASLEDALKESLDELDGTFTYLVSTTEGIGLARDAFATKPLVLAETDRWVALASEEIALRRAISEPFDTEEPTARTVRVWRHPGVATALTPVGAHG
jgi:methylamine---glutamate N-methyltransferase subunit A